MAKATDIYGDPETWEHIPMFSGSADHFSLIRCPQCGAAVLNAYQHKAWHIQFEGGHEG